jgi:nucleotide-binding universal stress UspA family protein
MYSVIVPTDYSENANHALRFAIYMSDKVKMKIGVFHWVEILIPTSTPPHLYKELYEEQKSFKLAQLKENVDKVLASLERKAEDVSIDYFLKDGSSLDDTLAEAVKECQADVVVMGTQGASGLTKFFMGSNTASVIDHANVPVIAIPEQYPLGPITKIGYASDLKDVVTEVAELVKFAKPFGASIEIFHVYPSFPQWADSSKENLDKISEHIHKTYPGQKFHLHVVQTYKENDTVYGIKKFVEGYKPDMLAMFTVKRTFWDKLFDSSRTEEVAFDVKVPLLTLKKA